MIQRLLRHFAQPPELAKFTPEEKRYGAHIMPVDAEHPANCVVSGPGTGDYGEWHLPMLDDDKGVFHVVPSRTAGHQHVYINKPLRWADYCRLLALLKELGLVDEAWADFCIAQNMATLRLASERDQAMALQEVPEPLVRDLDPADIPF